MKIVHAADLHLDSPLRGLTKHEGAPLERLRGATRHAFENLIGLCLSEQASILLIAGDLFDGDWRDYATGLYFVSQLRRLREAGIAVVLVRGNHDAQTQITRELRWPSNVHELPAKKPDTVRLESLGVAVHGQSYARRDVREDLADRYPSPEPGAFNIGLLHTALTGRPPHEPYAPTSLDVLRNKGYDYWALGHVHTREIVCEDPFVVFPGNLQGRHARETGPKGATVLTIEDGKLTELRAETLDAVRWLVCEVDASAAKSGHDVVDLAREQLGVAVQAASGVPVAARLVLLGCTSAHTSLSGRREHWEAAIRATAIDVAGGGLWLERIVHRTQEARDTQATPLAMRKDALGAVLSELDALLADPTLHGELCTELTAFRQKLPAAVREGEDGLRLDDPAFVETLLPEARDLVIARLLSEEPP